MSLATARSRRLAQAARHPAPCSIEPTPSLYIAGISADAIIIAIIAFMCEDITAFICFALTYDQTLIEQLLGDPLHSSLRYTFCLGDIDSA